LYKLKDLKTYLETDYSKRQLFPQERKIVFMEDHICLKAPPIICPKCGKKYYGGENICFDCLEVLKKKSDKINISKIKTNPQFIIQKTNCYDNFKDLLSDENIKKIKDFNFNCRDYNKIILKIKRDALKNLDNLIRENDIELYGLSITDKVMLFAKSFVSVNFKSQGEQLGYFENNTIFIDDRQKDSFKITTLIHELSHFLIHEIIVSIIAEILDASKNEYLNQLATFILSYDDFVCLVDEYAAHTVEGRFTVFGYQDYSSFIKIEKNLENRFGEVEIEIIKSIGNNFSLSIKNILESFIDEDLREEIKDQFEKECRESPNYGMLQYENCQKLNEEGFIQAVWLMIYEGIRESKVALNDRKTH